MAMKEEILTVIPGLEYLTYEQMNILINYQKLWSQLALWMREYAYSSLEESANLQTVITQLFDKLPLGFYNALKLFYGPEISQQFFDMFSRFLLSAARLVDAYKINDASRINTSAINWYQVADELATFLSTINVYWSKEQWLYLLYQYIRLVINEIIAIKNGEFEKEVNLFSNIGDLTDIMGSYMARGILARNAGIEIPIAAKHFNICEISLNETD